MDNIAIRVEGVSKDFRLPHEKTSSVKNIFVNAFRNIQKRQTVATQHALKDISFDIKKGEFFGIVGRNGSGKSTLLKILAGIYQPTKGKVEVRGKLVPFIELGVGFNPELTGRENVYLNGALLGFNQREVEDMYDEIVAFAELEKFMDQKLKNYSSGMQVRLAFSMAIRADTDILLVDEVLAVGDADFQRKCFDYFRQLKRNKKTVVFVSHDMDSVREYCDRAVMIEKSRTIGLGSPNDIATQYTRMFVEDNQKQSETSQKNKKDDRWGTLQLEHRSPTINVATQNININVKIHANEDAQDLILGFSIRDASGQSLLGTNSQIKGTKIQDMKKGQDIQIGWQFPNILKDGRYSVDLAAVDKTSQVLDWWEAALNFDVHKDEKVPYPVSPDIVLKIEQNE